MAALNVTCSMSAQHDWLLAEIARLMGAWRAWVVAGSVEDLAKLAANAAGRPCELVPIVSGQNLSVSDLRALGRHGREGLLACDTTLASTAICEPCLMGADIALERLDLLVGREGTELVAIGVSRDCAESEAIAEALDEYASQPENALQPWEPELLAARLEGHEERVRTGSDRAQELACYLQCHPRVEAVSYPGLKSDPSFAIASTNLHHGFGVYVDYMAAGEWHRVSALGKDGEPRALAELIADSEAELA